MTAPDGVTAPVVLAQGVPPTWQRLRPTKILWLPFGVALALSAVFAIRTGNPLWLLFAVGFTVFVWLGMGYYNVKPTNGTAWADDAGVHWSGKWGDYSYAWSQLDWIELAADQPGARLFNAVDPQGTRREGDTIGIALVVGGVPHYIHPVWTAAWDARIDFGCRLAAYARSKGVRVRVLQGDWGPEDVNREPGVGGPRTP